MRRRPCGEARHKHLRCRGSITKRGMRANPIVMTPPALDDDLRLTQRVEDLTVEEFVTQARIEALNVAVLPRTARRDVGGFRPDGRDPILYGLGHELRAVV